MLESFCNPNTIAAFDGAGVIFRSTCSVKSPVTDLSEWKPIVLPVKCGLLTTPFSQDHPSGPTNDSPRAKNCSMSGREDCAIPAALRIESNGRAAVRASNAAASSIVSISSGRFTSWNQGASRIFGYSSSEALTSGLDLIIPEEDRERIALKIEAVARGDVTFNFECQGVRKDGTPLDLVVTLSPLGEDRGIVGIITDVSTEV